MDSSVGGMWDWAASSIAHCCCTLLATLVAGTQTAGSEQAGAAGCARGSLPQVRAHSFPLQHPHIVLSSSEMIISYYLKPSFLLS